MIHRFASLWLAAGILALTACGGVPATTAPAATSATAQATTAALPTATTAAASPVATADVSATTEATVTSATGDETRIVKHAMGETAVPLHPQRVVVLDSGELDAAVALGVTPVGSFTLFEGEGFLSYLKEKLAGVQPVGTISPPNLEAIAALKPDLILSNKTRHEAIYDKLSAIAPTVFAASVGAVWRDNFKLYAEALGREQEGAQVIAAYEARLAAFKQGMGDRLTTQVSVLRVVEDGVRIIHEQMYIGVILADAGLARPSSQEQDDRFALVSLEQIPDMDGDVIFVSYYGKNDAAFKQLLAQPLWKANKAVAAGKVYPVDDDAWQTGLGYVAANLVIDDLERFLLRES
jgi:iron complex transport system substrate-binding protein